MITWEELRSNLNISEEDELFIALERELIDIAVRARKEKEMPQA